MGITKKTVFFTFVLWVGFDDFMLDFPPFGRFFQVVIGIFVFFLDERITEMTGRRFKLRQVGLHFSFIGLISGLNGLFRRICRVMMTLFSKSIVTTFILNLICFLIGEMLTFHRFCVRNKYKQMSALILVKRT